MVVDALGNKRCSTCGKTKKAREFNKNPTTQDGYQHQCKPCERKYQKEYRAKNKAREAARNAEWQRNNPRTRDGRRRET
jgi:hypothetical protein